MSTTVTIAGANFSVPIVGESNWGENTTALLIQLSSSTKVFQTTSSSFPLSQDVDFGATYGFKLSYLKSRATNPSATGVIRLGNTEAIGFRNAANTSDLTLSANASDQLTYNGNVITTSLAVTDTSTIDLTLASNNISAAIISNSVTNAHINSAAAIAYSKLNLVTSVVNNDISTSAAIALSKLAAVTASKVLVSDASGFISASSVTPTSLSYLDATSSIQTQINTKAPTASPTFTGTVSGITSAMVGLGSVDNTSDATKNAAVATLTNKTLTSPAINSATITSASIVTPARLDMKKDTLANLQTYAATATDGQLVYATDTLATYVIKGNALNAVGGSGGTNYILSPDADSGIGAWATYKNASGAATPDGTITGTANSTFAVSASTALRGTSNFLFTKNSGASRIGEGFYYPFTIDNSDCGKVLQCSFEYQIASGTFVDDAMELFIWDVTNSRLIQPAPSKLKNSGIIEKFAFEFQTSIDSTSYRLFAHVGVATNSSNTIRFDNFSVGPQAKLYGSPITDWVTTRTFTPSAAFGTTTLSTFSSKQVGDMMEVQGYFKLGTVAGTEANITLPNSIDSSKFAPTTAVVRIGTWTRIATSGSAAISSTDREGAIFYDGSTTNKVFFAVAVASNIFTKANGTDILATSDGFSLMFRYPILGVSSSQIMSSDADTRVITASYTRSGSVQTLNASSVPTVMNFNTKNYDDVGMVSVTTDGTSTDWKATAKVPGKYRFTIGAYLDSSANVLSLALGYKKTGGSVINITGTNIAATDRLQASITLDMLAGDYFQPVITYSTSSGLRTLYTAPEASIYIERISGPAQIMASESVSALFTGAPPTGTLAASVNTVTFGTKVKDSHNAYSSGTYTVPVSGTYSIVASTAQVATYSLNQIAETMIYVNGVLKGETVAQAGGAVSGQYPMASLLGIPLLAGDLVTIKTYNSGTSPTFNTAASQNYFSIVRTGNY